MHQDDRNSTQPATAPEQVPQKAPAPGHRANSLLTYVRRPIPGAIPRLRFEMPPEPPADETPDEKFGVPGPEISSRHPLYIGFVGTVGVGVALSIYYLMTNISQLLLWILAALFIALGLDPVVRWLENRKVSRPGAIFIVLSVTAALIAGFFATLIPTITAQTSELVQKAPDWITAALNSDFFKSLDGQYHVIDRINEQTAKFFQDSQAVGGIFGGVIGIGSSITNGLFGALIVLVLSLYFLASLPSMKRWAYRLAPRTRRTRVAALSEEITSSVGNYVIGQLCVAVLNATYAFIIMNILGVPFAALLAFVVALLAFIPLVGGMIAAILVSLVALGAGWQTGAAFAAFYFAYLQFEAYFISPRIMQKAVAVPGSVAVISVIAGGSLLGVLGALIAIPTAAAAMLLLREILITRQDRR